MNILVLNYYSRNSLGVVHGLGSEHRIVGADRGDARRSRGAWERFLRHPSVVSVERYRCPEACPGGFVADLASICRAYDIEFIVPTGTTCTNALSHLRPRIENCTGARCAVTDYERLLRATDKWHAHRVAQAVNVPVPQTRLFDPGADAATQVDGMRYPLVVKPRISYAAIGVHHVHSEHELEVTRREMLEREPGRSSSPPLIVQECVAGDLHDVAACAQDGKAIALVTQRRVVALYDFGGGGIVNLTTRDDTLKGNARRVLEYLEWEGPMLFDFIRAPDGTAYLLECNPKIWGTTDLVLEAGVNVVSMLEDIFVHQRQVLPVSEYETGLLYRWWFPECVYHWFHRPCGVQRVVSRLRRTFARNGAQRTASNLRARDLPHHAGIVANRLLR